MTTTVQILLGCLLLGVCSLLQIVVLVIVTRFIRAHTHHFKMLSSTMSWLVLFVFSFSAVVVSHTIQVWLWAFSFVGLGALSKTSEAIYFSLVTYTTVGYGDVTLGENFRVYAAMASVTGLLNFGLSTAFLVGLFTRMLQNDGNTDRALFRGENEREQG